MAKRITTHELRTESGRTFVASEVDDEFVIAETVPAGAESKAVLWAPVNDGRSGWTWIRLANGDLILGVYPLGETYESLAMKVDV